MSTRDEPPRQPDIVVGYRVRYESDEDAFTTYQTFQPEDGEFYRVVSVVPRVFLPGEDWFVSTFNPETPLVFSRSRGGSGLSLSDAIERGYVVVTDRWERPT